MIRYGSLFHINPSAPLYPLLCCCTGVLFFHQKGTPWPQGNFFHHIFIFAISMCSVGFLVLCLPIDPLGLPTVTAGSDHWFANVVRPSVRSHFFKIFTLKTMVTTGKTVGLAEWIIDDTCHVYIFLLLSRTKNFAKLQNQAYYNDNAVFKFNFAIWNNPCVVKKNTSWNMKVKKFSFECFKLIFQVVLNANYYFFVEILCSRN